MLKIMNLYQREAIENSNVAFYVAPTACQCAKDAASRSATQSAGPGCQCSCIGAKNMVYNLESVRIR